MFTWARLLNMALLRGVFTIWDCPEVEGRGAVLAENAAVSCSLDSGGGVWTALFLVSLLVFVTFIAGFQLVALHTMNRARSAGISESGIKRFGVLFGMYDKDAWCVPLTLYF